MRHRSHRLSILVAVSLASGASATWAEEHVLGQHPAVIVHARASVIDPNSFIVAPPAAATWVHAHANQEHPALQVARMASHATIDSNTFTVQPPASVTWTLASGEEAPPAVRRTALLH